MAGSMAGSMAGWLVGWLGLRRAVAVVVVRRVTTPRVDDDVASLLLALRTTSVRTNNVGFSPLLLKLSARSTRPSTHPPTHPASQLAINQSVFGSNVSTTNWNHTSHVSAHRNANVYPAGTFVFFHWKPRMNQCADIVTNH